MVVHGVDGYSRMIVYLQCSNNNRAETVVQLFTEAVSAYALPSRVRENRGGENVQVADFVIAQRGMNRGSFICGRSVHNQRIAVADLGGVKGVQINPPFCPAL